MPFAIRAAMRDGVGHALQEPRRNRMAIGVDDPGDAAHGSLPLSCMIMMARAAQQARSNASSPLSEFRRLETRFDLKG
jgi:hypothetical protein